MVYVLNREGTSLMPTTRYGRVRRLLRKGYAVVVDYRPFTIQLTYDTPNGVQGVSLGVDAGTKHVGFSATTKKKVFFEAELLLRSDIVEKLSTRREFRRARRNRKTRYRKSRFLNRTKSKKPGWLAPSVRQKMDCHIYWISKICKFLPIRKITVETAQFDTQLLKAQEQGLPLPRCTDYSTDNAWRICSSWSGKCAIYPFNEWKHEGDTFYHRKDPTKFLRVNSWSYRVTEVKVGADGQLVE